MCSSARRGQSHLLSQPHMRGAYRSSAGPGLLRLQRGPWTAPRAVGAVGGRRCSCSCCRRTWAPGSRKSSLPQLGDSGVMATSASENQRCGWWTEDLSKSPGGFSRTKQTMTLGTCINDAMATKMCSLSPVLAWAVVFTIQAQ